MSEDELEITLRIPETDFTGIEVLVGISYLEKKLPTEHIDSHAYHSCRAALKILRVIMAKIEAQEIDAGTIKGDRS